MGLRSSRLLPLSSLHDGESVLLSLVIPPLSALCSFLFTAFFSSLWPFQPFLFLSRYSLQSRDVPRLTVPGHPQTHSPGTSPFSAQPRPGFQLSPWTRPDLLAVCKALIAEGQTLDVRAEA